VPVVDAPTRQPARNPAAALSLAFAWGPAIDLVTEAMRASKGATGSASRIALALLAIASRYGIARIAFAPGSFGRAFFRLPLLTFVLGAALRAISLAPLFATATQAGRGATLFQSIVFAPALVALYTATLPLLLRRPGKGSMAEFDEALLMASVWVALPQVALSYFGFWEVNWKRGLVGLEWELRCFLGVVLPIAAAVGVAIGSRQLRSRHRWRSALLAWIILPAGGIVALSGLAAVPLPFVPHPLVVANARARDGTQIAIVETEDDPYDVYLNVRRPDKPWTRYRLAYGDPLWAGNIDLGPGDPIASVSAYGVEVAVLRQNDDLELRVPLTGFVGIPRVIDSPFEEHY
jgi:hypothetical protein